VKCPACGTENLADAARCANCGAALPSVASGTAPVPAAGAQGPARSLPVPLLIGGVACLVLGALVMFLVFGRTNAVEASVASVHWERAVEIEAYGPVEREGWRDEIPAEAQLGACRLEHYTSQPNPAPVATEVCGTPYTVDEGSGYGEVVQDCVYEVYQDRCSYVVQEWSVVDTVTSRADSLRPAWPSMQLGSDQRAGRETESYSVVLASDSETYTYRPESEAEFLQFELGSMWSLEVNALGGIRSIEPAR
jgi:hypothetical protein